MEENLKIITASKDLILKYITELIELDTYYFEYLGWNENAFLSDLPEKFEKSLLVLVNDKLIGYSIISKKENTYHLHKFVINPDFKSKGLGQLLIDNLYLDLNYHSLTLKVEVANIDAIVFYLKKKFIFTEKSGDYYHMIYYGK